MVVPPKDGYGSKDLTAVHEAPKKNVPEEIKVGSQLHGKECHPAAGRRFPDIGAGMHRDMGKLRRFLDTQSRESQFDRVVIND